MNQCCNTQYFARRSPLSDYRSAYGGRQNRNFYKDPYNNLPTLPTVVIVSPIATTVTIQEDTLIPITTTQATMADKDLGSIIVRGQQ
jgi:hypothetical protein